MKNAVTALLLHFAKVRLKRSKRPVIAVAGSVGKTSTKSAIETILAASMKVLTSSGGLNTEIGVPLVVLELSVPNSRSPFVWLLLLMKGFLASFKQFKHDVIVLELGVDHPGDMDVFKRIVHPKIAVLTAATAEHLEYFGSLEIAQAEELKIADFSDLLIANVAMVPVTLLSKLDPNKVQLYGPDAHADYQLTVESFDLHKGFTITAKLQDSMSVVANVQVVGEHSLQPVLAAAAVARQVGLDEATIKKGIERIRPFPGRMQLLQGVERNSWIIDDSYNAVSAESSIAALKTLMAVPATQHIAILGSMNELGSFSQSAHEEVGSNCDPKKLDLVITIGKDAKDYLAPIAALTGCEVKSFMSPVEAGEFALSLLKPGGVVLVKGSQFGVYSEEAVKLLLRNPSDEAKLVRQSEEWLAKKRSQGFL